MKAGIDLVTATDLACEDAIRANLTESFPNYPVIGEERGGAPQDGKPYWLVDPICGTRMFASELPLYCTNIALVEDGAVSAAAVGIGRTGEILFAERGSGAWMRTSAGQHRLETREDSNTIWVGAMSKTAGRIVQCLLSTKRWYVLQFPSSLSYAYLAAGRISGIIHTGHTQTPHGSVHTAAGCFVASEAGVVITDLDEGTPWSLETSSFLGAATSELHRKLQGTIGRPQPNTASL